jgi:hypothetical protein
VIVRWLFDRQIVVEESFSGVKRNNINNKAYGRKIGNVGTCRSSGSLLG